MVVTEKVTHELSVGGVLSTSELSESFDGAESAVHAASAANRLPAHAGASLWAMSSIVSMNNGGQSVEIPA